MTTRIGFLRAVNLGKRTVHSARLIEVVSGLGHGDVWTYIASGNVVFDAAGSRADLEAALEEAFEAEFAFEVTTFVRTASELHAVVEEDPFDLGPGDTHYVTFLKDPPSAAVGKELEGLSNDFDTILVRGRDVHWHMRGKSTDSTLKTKDWNPVGGKLGTTSRNMTMLRKLDAKVQALD